MVCKKPLGVKGCISLFHHSIDMRADVSLSISCWKNMFLLENFNKIMFFLHEMDKLTSVLMSIEWWNRERQPLVELLECVISNFNILNGELWLFWILIYFIKATLSNSSSKNNYLEKCSQKCIKKTQTASFSSSWLFFF